MFQGFECDATGEPVAPTECLACARAGALPGCHQTAPVIAGILRGLRPESMGLSITTLLGCARKTRLQREVDYWLKPSQSYWAYRGQLMRATRSRSSNCLA